MKNQELTDLIALAVQSTEADGVEATLVSQSLQELRLANNAVIQSMELETATLSIRAIVNGVAAVATTNNMSREGIAIAAKRAGELASVAGKRTGDYPTLSSADPPAPIQLVSPVCETTLGRSTEEHIESLLPAIQRSSSDGTSLAGHSRSGLRQVHFLSSTGRQRHHASSLFDTMVIATSDQGTSGHASQAGTSIQGLDIGKLGEKSVQDALLGRNPMSLEPGAYDVILEPEAVTELVEWLVGIGFTSGAYEDGLSFIRGREGKQITGADISIFDDGWCDNGIGIPLPFDSQGEWKQKTHFLESGIAKGIAHDRQSAARFGCQSTGHATLADDMPEGSSRPEHVVMGGGNATEGELLNRVNRGLWVSRFHYVNGLLEPKRAVMTGLTRDGCFMIENGKRVAGVKTLRFTDSILEALERCDGISQQLKVVPTWWSEGGAFVAPTMLIRGLQFTGQSRE